MSEHNELDPSIYPRAKVIAASNHIKDDPEYPYWRVEKEHEGQFPCTDYLVRNRAGKVVARIQAENEEVVHTMAAARHLYGALTDCLSWFSHTRMLMSVGEPGPLLEHCATVTVVALLVTSALDAADELGVVRASVVECTEEQAQKLQRAQAKRSENAKTCTCEKCEARRAILAQRMGFDVSTNPGETPGEAG